VSFPVHRDRTPFINRIQLRARRNDSFLSFSTYPDKSNRNNLYIRGHT